MFGVSGTEFFLIAVFALIIFGPDKLPAFARTLGRFMNEFKRAQQNVETMLRAEMYGADKDDAGSADTAAAQPVPIVENPMPTFGDDDDEEEDEE